MRIFLFALFALFSCTSSPERSRLAICAIFKNEAPWLKEWIAYHANVLGVSHFYLYNDKSEDNYLEVLEPYIEVGLVEVIDWDSSDPAHILPGGNPGDGPWIPAQIGAYNECLKTRALGKEQWVAMIDIDEFIVPAKGVPSFYALLKQAEKSNKGSVSLKWHIFGTSNVKELGEKELLTERLTWRARDDHPWHELVKSIHRPEAVEKCLVHIAIELKPGFGARTLKPEQASIHHYWTRTENFCKEKRKNLIECEPDLLEALHQVEDQTIFQYLPALGLARDVE